MAKSDLREELKTSLASLKIDTISSILCLNDSTSEDLSPFTLNIENLEHILLEEKIADKKVAIISVAGGYRKGKSFLLNFFLKYLKYTRDKGVGPIKGEWLKYESKLNGFKWRSGTQPETMGIVIWSEPFIVKNSAGEELVVLLMDTQGTFDHDSSVKDCSVIFALSTMISSVQIYNLIHNIQEDHLQQLQFFAEYGRLATNEYDNSKVFQSLIFVVRDWSLTCDDGLDGGNKYLMNDVLKTDGKRKENQELRTQIMSSFEKIECCLVPSPGKKVAREGLINRKISDIDDDFLNVICKLVPHVLAPENIAPKKINGETVTCRQLFEFIKAISSVFESNDTFEPESLYTASAKVYNAAIVDRALVLYNERIHEKCDGKSLGVRSLEAIHSECREAAIQLFNSTRKMGSAELIMQFLEHLEDKIKARYIPQLNDAKLVDLENFTAYNNALKFYNDTMFENRGSDFRDYEERHRTTLNAAINYFLNEKRGDWDTWSSHLHMLKGTLQNTFISGVNVRSRIRCENYDAIMKAKVFYLTMMKNNCGENYTMDIEGFNSISNRYKDSAFQLFDETPKAGDEEVVNKYRDILRIDLSTLEDSLRYAKLSPRVEYRDKFGCNIS